ncbi:MAG: hypothetical protein AB2417_13170 [Clostridiaceae bacterium]
MVEQMNRACEQVNKRLGVSIKLPNPSKEALRVNAIISGLLGVGIVGAGVLTKYKWVTGFGTAVVLGNLIHLSSLKASTKK